MSTFVAELDLFAEQVRSWTAAALTHRPPSFGALLRALPGVDPGLVSDELARTAVGSGSLAERLHARTLLADARTSRAALPPSRLPIPHPLDCYWPNDPFTLRALTNRLARAVAPGATIAYLAWPNAFADAGPRLPDRKHVLFEGDRARAAVHRAGTALHGHRVHELDVLRDELPPLRAHAILADPPWYPTETKAFLWAAARLAAPGAAILLALPPLGTRPGIDLERREVLDWAAACGLRARTLKTGVLGYLTPPFERAALAARGIPGTPDGWRRGDLLLLEARPARLPQRPLASTDDWREARIEDLPVRVRVDHPPPLAPISETTLLSSLVDGDVLASVSRRTALRHHTRLWTGRNRVFASSHPELLAAIVDALATGSPPATGAAAHLRRPLGPEEQQALRRVAERLKRVLALERHEHGLP